MEVGNKTYAFHVVAVPEFDFINIYGTDVTAAEDNRLISLKLSKYFSPQVYESIFSGDLEVKIEARRKRLTVFFSDIKGFSELTERLEPEILTELVTCYLTEMTNIAKLMAEQLISILVMQLWSFLETQNHLDTKMMLSFVFKWQ